MCDFNREYLCEFPVESEDYKKAKLFWALYYYLTEEYDRRICTGGRNKIGEAMPASVYERNLITRHAGEIYRKIKSLLMPLPKKDVEDAKSIMARLSHDQICEYLKQIPWEEEYGWIRDGRI